MHVVVARHGERWDYLQRDAGKGEDYIRNAERPWDPPLSPNGLKQASRLGSHLAETLQALDLPPITACYTSPFLRCRQTACQAVEALNSENSGLKEASDDIDTSVSASTTSHPFAPLKVQIELGLSESLNESWYRSWALPGADGTWGFYPEKKSGTTRRHLHEFTADELHPSSQVPAQELLLPWQPIVTHTLHEEDIASNNLLGQLQDMNYASSTNILTPFALKPKVLVESKKEQQERMLQVLRNKTRDGVGKTILCVSHGGPVTHLYTKLTGNDWTVHGESKYCCYSIYELYDDHLSPTAMDSADKKDKEGDSPQLEQWKPLVVNQSKYLDDLWSDATSNI